MLKGLFAAVLIIFSGFLSRPDFKVYCRIKSGAIVHVRPEVCKKIGGKIVSPTPTLTPTPKPTSTPTPTVTPTTSPIPTVTPTQTPTPTPIPSPEISKVIVGECTPGESCYGWLTVIEIQGVNFTADSRTKLVNGADIYLGTYTGGDGKTQIITDFTALPHCSTFDAVVYGTSGTVTSSASVQTLCP